MLLARCECARAHLMHPLLEMAKNPLHKAEAPSPNPALMVSGVVEKWIFPAYGAVLWLARVTLSWGFPTRIPARPASPALGLAGGSSRDADLQKDNAPPSYAGIGY
ncbi:hypothetical protein AOLI_G00254390 [Acnodon oligacanthus]